MNSFKSMRWIDHQVVEAMDQKMIDKAPISGVLSFAVDSELIENNPLDSLKLKHKKRDFKVEPLWGRTLVMSKISQAKSAACSGVKICITSVHDGYSRQSKI